MITLIALAAMAQAPASIKVVDLPDSMGKNDYYVGNRQPLTPSYFRKLPIGTIQPMGWVRKQLTLQADGFVGHLTEISPWLDKKNNAWLSATGEGEHGWEEVPYWLKGFGDLGYVLGDERITKEARTWIEGVLASQRSDGYFGPKANLTANDGKPDVWPNMVMLNALQSYYEFSKDPRIVDFMTKYFKWQLSLPEDSLLLSYWERQRGGDNIASVYWLYNLTAENWLLDLAEKLHRRTAPWEKGVPDWHGVNFAQAFREPAEMFVLTKNPAQLQATEDDYQTMRGKFGQVPGGLYGADENAREGYSDPRQAAETCAMVEMMLSDEMLLTLTGDRKWAERCEDVTFNSLPASMTPDLKALHYLTAPNMAVADKESKSPGLQNGGPMLLFNPYDHRCCQHNVSHGWPYYAEHLWLATSGNGLGVALYAPSKVTAKVGTGQPVTITEQTTYPFEETVTFNISTERPNRFPLTLRLPSWSANPKIRLNGKTLELPNKGAYAIIDREWRDGDRVELKMPMDLKFKTWPSNNDAVSVNYGPLTFSLFIGEKYVREGGTDAWPAYEIHPTTPWNYGLVDVGSGQVSRRAIADDAQPFDPDNAPLQVKLKGRRVPQWQLDRFGLVAPLQPSPAFSTEPIETITLIPMGAARLRITAFPVTTTDPRAHKWSVPEIPKAGLPAKASHVFQGDSLNALTDTLLPKSSSDLSIPRFTWWDHKGSSEWVEIALPKATKVSQASIYWFDDSPSKGFCRAPEKWKLLYEANGKWKEVDRSGPYGTVINRLNLVHFTPVTASRFRIEAKLKQGYSAGILEWILK